LGCAHHLQLERHHAAFCHTHDNLHRNTIAVAFSIAYGYGNIHFDHDTIVEA
jgi:hypothetical protein